MNRTSQCQNCSTVLMGCVIFLVALNLRPAIVAVGPLLSDVGATFGWGESLQGLLGALPLLAFALFSIFVSSITAKLGIDRVLFWALVVLAGGCLIRSLLGEGAVWLGTLLIGASIAAGNVLAPAIVKRDFVDHVSFATGAYSACVTSGSALAGLTASAAADALGGWQPALALWALPALAAALLWLARSRYLRMLDRSANSQTARPFHAAVGSDAPKANEKKTTQASATDAKRENGTKAKPESTSHPKPTARHKQLGQYAEPAQTKEGKRSEQPLLSLLRKPSTWFVTLFMGLQSAAFYTFCNWLPSIAVSAGFTSGEAGLHLFIFQVLGIFSGLAIPRFMYVRNNQICAGVLASAPLLIASAGWLFAPRLSLLWSVFGGIGQGASLVVALTLISLRGSTHAETVALSGFAQSLGYFIAACGPFAFGAIVEATSAFALSLCFMAALALAQCAVAVLAGRAPQKGKTR